MPTRGVSNGARDPRLDALRGFALLGILWVNIQSYVYGATNPIGFLPAGARFPIHRRDTLATFLATKRGHQNEIFKNDVDAAGAS